MNRYGLILDDKLCDLYDVWLQQLVQKYIRPIALALFRDFAKFEDCNDFYAFTVRYATDEDIVLPEHRDASVITLNINLDESEPKQTPCNDNDNNNNENENNNNDSDNDNDNDRSCTIMPTQSYLGSELQFVVDAKISKDTHATVRFDPGMTVFHLGAHRHAALPIESGTRTNLVIWLHGVGGYVRVAPYQLFEQHTVRERWNDGRESQKTDIKLKSSF